MFIVDTLYVLSCTCVCTRVIPYIIISITDVELNSHAFCDCQWKIETARARKSNFFVAHGSNSNLFSTESYFLPVASSRIKLSERFVNKTLARRHARFPTTSCHVVRLQETKVSCIVNEFDVNNLTLVLFA